MKAIQDFLNGKVKQMIYDSHLFVKLKESDLSVLRQRREICANKIVIVCNEEFLDSEVLASFSKKISGILPEKISEEEFLFYYSKIKSDNVLILHHSYQKRLIERYNKNKEKPCKRLVLNPERAEEILQGKEIVIYDALIRGLSNGEIASCTNLSENTVKNYLQRIFEKLNAEDRVQAIWNGIKKGIVVLE